MMSPNGPHKKAGLGVIFVSILTFADDSEVSPKTSYASSLAWSPKWGGAADSYSGVLIGLCFIAGC